MRVCLNLKSSFPALLSNGKIETLEINGRSALRDVSTGKESEEGNRYRREPVREERSRCFYIASDSYTHGIDATLTIRFARQREDALAGAASIHRAADRFASEGSCGRGHRRDVVRREVAI